MEEPKIAERVKFWQEQDRINRELIPRVIKNHELLSSHVESHEDGDSLARAQIESLEARAVELETASARGLARIEALEGRIAELEQDLSEGLSQWIPHAALALALVALSLAVVR
jgi:hypothetical protein